MCGQGGEEIEPTLDWQTARVMRLYSKAALHKQFSLTAHNTIVITIIQKYHWCASPYCHIAL